MNAALLQLNNLRDQLSNLVVPPNSFATFHLKGCDKKEISDLAQTINTKLITPEENIYADCYTLKIDHDKQTQILLHSNK